MRDLIGTTLGKYSIVALLGQGGMANVYRAHQPRLDRYVAIKVMHSHLAEDPDFVGRFEREATAVARLQHPGIVKIHDFDADDGLYYMVMELIEGPTLKAEIRARYEHSQPFTMGEIDRIVTEIAQAIGYAHDQGIVHRDLKPANAMLAPTGRIVLTDFGLAHILDASHVTRTGITSGTPEYMSPEQAKGERGDERTDVYALGVMLYEMVAGRLPFIGETSFAIIRDHVNSEPPPPSQFNPGISTTLEGVILTALQKDPAHRFQSIPEMAEAVAMALAAVHPVEAPMNVLAPTPEVDTATESRMRGTDFRQMRPYRGLFAFQEEDAPFFFGREAFTAKLLNQVEQNGMAAVIGPSGSGKSSVVFAGLIPRLREKAAWTIVHLRPGSQPFHALADAFVPLLEPGLNEVDRLVATGKLAQALEDGTLSLQNVVDRVLTAVRTNSGKGDLGEGPSTENGHHLLLVADQFEELYTLCTDIEERQQFTAALLDMVQNNGAQQSPLVLVLTLRADFMGQALADRPLADTLQWADVKLGPMTREELARAIEQPATQLGASFEPGLVERILDDVGSEPGNLPLLEFALTLLWDRRAGRRLTHAAYEAIGRVEGSLARYADKVYARLSDEEQQLARRVFTQMVRPGEGTEDTRRLSTRAELGEPAWSLVQRLADERLVVTGRDPSGQETVEVIHEALIRGWRRLQEWMDADRNFRAWQERLRAGLRQWEQGGGDEALLLRGSVLNEAENWQTTRTDNLGEDEHSFIQASVDLREREAAEQRARQARELETARRLAESERQRAEVQAESASKLRRRAWVLAGALVVAIVLAVLAGVFGRQAVLNAQRAQEQRQVAEERRIEAEEARADAESRQREAEEAQAEAERQKAEANRQRDEAQRQRQMALSRQFAAQSATLLDEQLDRALLLSLEASRISDTTETRSSLLAALQHNPRLVTFLRGHPLMMSLTFSPDGRMLASAGGNGTVRLWSIEYPAEGDILIEPWDDPLVGHDQNELVNNADFSPDGTLLATASDDLTVRLWDTATGELLHTFTGFETYVQVAIFSPDGRILATSGGEPVIRLWDVNTRELMATLPTQTLDNMRLAFSPDGQALAAANAQDSTIVLWDMATLQPRGEPLSGHTLWITGLDFSPDGQTLVSADAFGPVIRFWDVATATPAGELDTQRTVAMRSAIYARDGQSLYVRSEDGLILQWDLETGETIGQALPGNTTSYTNVALSPDGRLLASADNRGTILVWDASGDLQLGRPVTPAPAYSANRLAFSPDGRTMANSTMAGEMVFYDIASGAVLYEPAAHSSLEPVGISGIALHPDGEFLFTNHSDGSTSAWLLEGEVQEFKLGTFHIYGETLSRMSPSGAWMAMGDVHGHVTLWGATTGSNMSFLLGQQDTINDLAFNPEEDMVVSASDDGTVNLWHFEGYRYWSLGTLAAQPDGASSVAINDEGTLMAAGGHDGRIMRWSLPELDPLDSTEQVHETTILAITFEANTLFSVGRDGNVMRWAQGEQPQPLLPAGENEIETAAFAGTSLALGYRDGSIAIWDLGTLERILLDSPEPPAAAITCLSFSGGQLAAGYQDGTVQLWDLDNPNLPRSWALEEHNPVGITQIAYSPDGRTAASGSFNGTIILWDTATGQPIRQLFTPPSMIQDLAFGPEGRLLASAHCAHFDEEKLCDQGKVVLWDVESGELIRELVGHTDFVQSIAFSPRGDILASGGCGLDDVGGTCQAGEVLLWDVDTGNRIGQPLTGHANTVLTLAFSPDGSLLASGGEDNNIILWDPRSGQQVGQRLTGHQGIIRTLQFNPDGTLLASGGYGRMQDYTRVQGEVILWDVATGQRLGDPWTTYDGYVFDLAFHPDGQEVFFMSGRGTINRMDVSLERWQERACRIANRNLTQEEWTQLFGEDAYRETCTGR